MSEPLPLNERIPALAARRKAWLECCGLPTEADVIAEIHSTIDAIKRGDALDHRVTLALLAVDLGILRGPAIAGELVATSTSWGDSRSQPLGYLIEFVEVATVCNRAAVHWASICSRGTGLGAIDFIAKMEAMHDAMEATARPFDVAEFYGRKAAWSRETLGPRQRVAGVVAHLRKELVELQGAIVYGPVDPIREELADICLLAIDLSWRAGGCAAELAPMSGDPIEPAAAAEYIEARLKVADVLANVSEGGANRDVWQYAFRAEAALLWGCAFCALGCDGTPIEAKFAAVQKRTWPDWRTIPADQPIEHVRAEGERNPGDSGLDRERAEWRWNNEILRDERQRVRKVLGAQPHEGAIEAAIRVMGEAETPREERRQVRETLGAAPDETALCAARRMDRQRLIFEKKYRAELRLLLGSLVAS